MSNILSNDFQLIIECCKEKPSIIKINKYLKNLFNWKMLISLSLRNGVLPLVFKTLNSLDNINIPPDILAELRSQYFEIAKKNMLLSSELIKIAKLFRENSIDILFFKGPTLSSEIYGDITLRQYCDLDLLIKKEDINKVSQLLVSSGMKTNLNIKSLNNELLISTANDFSFFTENNTHIELHWNLFRQLFNKKTNIINVWENKKEIVFKKNNITVLKNEYLFVYLCIHGSKHLWERIEWLTDINKFIIKENLNWDLIITLAKELNSSKMLFLALTLCYKLLQAKLPNSILIELNNNQIEKLSKDIMKMYEKNICLKEGKTSDILFKFILLSRMKENNFEKVKYLFSSIFKPTQYDIYFIKLPEKVFYLYYIIRPYRFIYKLFRK